jgi:hypothetical protein
MLQTLKLNNKNLKKSLFYEEKSLVGLTPDILGAKLVPSLVVLLCRPTLICKCFKLIYIMLVFELELVELIFSSNLFPFPNETKGVWKSS